MAASLRSIARAVAMELLSGRVFYTELAGCVVPCSDAQDASCALSADSLGADKPNTQ